MKHGQTSSATCDEEAGRGRRLGAEKIVQDIGWSDEKKSRGCNKEEATEKHRLYRFSSGRPVRNQIPEISGEKWTDPARCSSASCIRSLAENARDEGCYSRFVLINMPRGQGGGGGAEVADAVRYANRADHSWTPRERVDLRRQEENDAKYPEITSGAAS